MGCPSATFFFGKLQSFLVWRLAKQTLRTKGPMKLNGWKRLVLALSVGWVLCSVFCVDWGQIEWAFNRVRVISHDQLEVEGFGDALIMMSDNAEKAAFDHKRDALLDTVGVVLFPPVLLWVVFGVVAWIRRGFKAASEPTVVIHLSK